MTVKELIEKLESLPDNVKDFKVLCPVSDYSEEITRLEWAGTSNGEQFVVLEV